MESVIMRDPYYIAGLTDGLKLTDEVYDVLYLLRVDMMIFGRCVAKREDDKLIRIPPEDWCKSDAT